MTRRFLFSFLTAGAFARPEPSLDAQICRVLAEMRAAQAAWARQSFEGIEQCYRKLTECLLAQKKAALSADEAGVTNPIS